MARVALQVGVLRAIWRGKRRFRRDPRYRTQFVWTSPASDDADDEVLLRRICTAYRLATERQASAHTAFTASRWWRIVEDSNLRPVRRALAEGDINSLRAMYRQFFRDPCGAGLVGLPVDMARSYRRPNIPRRYRHLLLADALHRLEIWREKTQGRFSIDALQGPETGGPFGVLLGDILVRPGAPDHHYYARKIMDLVSVETSLDVARKSACATVVEIGGGFGGMAYYLIRDYPGVTYIDFDLPETIALAAYYLAKAFPHLRVTLYGEQSVCGAGIFLLPAFAMAEIPPTGADVVFSSHLFSDLAPAALEEYLKRILHAAPAHFLHVDGQTGCAAVSEYMEKDGASLALAGLRHTHWNDGCAAGSNEYEALYVKSATSAKPV